MKKRWICIALLLTLILSMLPMPAQAANFDAARFRGLANYISNHGTKDLGNAYSIRQTKWANSTNYVSYYITYYSNTDSIKIGKLTSYKTDSNNVSHSFEVVIKSTDANASTLSGSRSYLVESLFTGKLSSLSYVDKFSFSPASYKRDGSVPNLSFSGSHHSTAKDISDELTSVLDWVQRNLTGTGYSEIDLGFVSFITHKWDSGKVIKAATCQETGIRTYTCSLCGNVKTETIPVVDHKWNSSGVSTEPTCTNQGVRTYQCANCRTTRTESIPALGHAYTVDAVIREATESAHGYASYSCSRCGATKNAELCANEVFIDTPAKGNWAHNGIDWAYFNGVTNGTSGNTFSPNAGCTRAQVVTFLWRAMGSSAPKNTVNPFRDVVSGDYYYNAVLWAVENGITKGTDTSHFTPDKTCTRGEIVTFLWRSVGKPDPRTASHSFTDVVRNAFYYDAMLWAVENEVTNGTSSATFSPDGTCTRAQVVTFLYRALKTISDNALEQAIQEAEAIRLNNYIPDSRQPLIDALAAGKALMEQGGYTREEADAAAEAIRLAISALISNPDRRSLAATIRECSGYDESKYTAVSWQALQTELAAAQEVMDNPNATQEMINTAKSALTRAMKQLEIKEELLTGTCGDQVTWTLSRRARVLRISGTGKMRDYRLSGDYAPWYQYESYIDAVVIDEGVTSIGRGAFHNLTQLIDITFPASVAIIGPFAFHRCTSLTELTIPDTVTEIGYDAFYYCPSLKKVTLPKGLTYIADELFCNCNYLEEITIPEGVTVIGSYAFKGCGTIDYIDKRYVALGMKSVTIPKSVMSIEESAFGNCFALTDVYYGGSADDWAKISIGSDNEDLEEATIHFAK